jgi:hypothetical protein
MGGKKQFPYMVQVQLLSRLHVVTLIKIGNSDVFFVNAPRQEFSTLGSSDFIKVNEWFQISSLFDASMRGVTELH